jgi:DMSO/TMAO reductase YedYZ heme-binding membrane subunit
MKFIRFIQNSLIGISLVLLVYISLWAAFGDENNEIRSSLYDISFFAVFLVMMIRPLADIFYRSRLLRRLVILRKGFGIFSASIVVGFLIGNIITPESSYINSIFTTRYWSFVNGIVFAHIGDITGLILLITSNKLSMAVLGKNWKRLQKLAYVYFYSGGLYEVLALNSKFALYAMIIVTLTAIVAGIVNFIKRKEDS